MSGAYFVGGRLNGECLEVPANLSSYLSDIGGRYVRRKINLHVGFYHLVVDVFVSAECATTPEQHEAAWQRIFQRASEEIGVKIGGN